MIGIYPKLLKINIKTLIINFILYNIFRSKSEYPNKIFDYEEDTYFNKKIYDKEYSWGGFWTIYGFDEKFFKHTLFPYIVEKRRGY